MTVAEMRCAIYDIYPGDIWHTRVINMPDDQVIAVYRSFQDRNLFVRRKQEILAENARIIAERRRRLLKGEATDEQTFKPLIGEQLTLF